MLISILVMSAVLLILALSVSDTQITTANRQLNTSSNKATYYIAESCYEEAANKLKEDSTYLGETLVVDGGDCLISVAGGEPKTISITANYENYTQTYESEVSVIPNGEINNIRLLKWQKI